MGRRLHCGGLLNTRCCAVQAWAGRARTTGGRNVGAAGIETSWAQQWDMGVWRRCVGQTQALVFNTTSSQGSVVECACASAKGASSAHRCRMGNLPDGCGASSFSACFFPATCRHFAAATAASGVMSLPRPSEARCPFRPFTACGPRMAQSNQTKRFASLVSSGVMEGFKRATRPP